MATAELLIRTLRLQHRMPASRLLGELRVSRPTLMRALRAAGPSVLSIGRARRTSCVARRALRGSDAALPVYRVDVRGGSVQVARMHLAYPDGCVLEQLEGLEWPVDADTRDGWFEGIPYPMQDLRPEGFLGRAFARECEHLAAACIAQLPGLVGSRSMPMLYAPERGMEPPERRFTPRLPLPAERGAWQQAARAALAFWGCASQDVRISAGFRQTCAGNARAVEDAISLLASSA